MGRQITCHTGNIVIYYIWRTCLFITVKIIILKLFKIIEKWYKYNVARYMYSINHQES